MSAWTGVPVERMAQDDCDRLLALPEALRGRVVGQESAVDAAARALMRAGSGLKHPDRPIASLLFAGPTGAHLARGGRAGPLSLVASGRTLHWSYRLLTHTAVLRLEA